MLIRNQQRSCEYILNFQVFTDSDDTCQGYVGYMGRKYERLYEWKGNCILISSLASISLSRKKSLTSYSV